VMTDYNYQRLIEQIASMSAWQIIAASAVTAQKVAPIVRSLALPDTWRTAERSLALAWRSISDPQSNCDEAKQLLHELNAAPEWQCEYPDTLVFYVCKPLDLVRAALEPITERSLAKVAENIGFSHILDIADELDVAASDYPDLVSHRLEITKTEEASQMSLVAILTEHDVPSDELLETLRQESMSISRLIETALPTFCYGFISALCGGDSQ